MSFKTLELKVDERKLATITLQRPEVHNAMNMEFILEMRDALAKIRRTSGLRALLLTGAGKSFCAGADLRWMREMTNQDSGSRMRDAEELVLLLSELDSLKLPVIGRINGPAYGGGLGLVACCDIAIGVESSFFALSEVTLGLIPATISPYVVRCLGESNARRVMLNAHRFNAWEALRMGLLHVCVPDLDLDNAVEQELRGILCSAPEAVAASKELISAIEGRSPGKVSAETALMLTRTWETESCKEGIAAFLEKRKPKWAVLES